MAITEEGELYGWGEAKLGQIGTGKKDKEIRPVLVDLQIEDAKPVNIVKDEVEFKRKELDYASIEDDNDENNHNKKHNGKK